MENMIDQYIKNIEEIVLRYKESNRKCYMDFGLKFGEKDRKKIQEHFSKMNCSVRFHFCSGCKNKYFDLEILIN